MADETMTMCWHGDVDGPGHTYVRPHCPALQVRSNASLGITPRAEREDQ